MKLSNKLASLILVALVSVTSFPKSLEAQNANNPHNDLAIDMAMDGTIFQLRNEETQGFLRQGYGASRDDKRNVEADRGLFEAPRGKGFEWVLRPAGKGLWYIVNVKTLLHLTMAGSSKEASATNWGWHKPKDNHFKWKLDPVIGASGSGAFSRQFYLINHHTGSYLRTSGGDVRVSPFEARLQKHMTWRFARARSTPFEEQIRAITSNRASPNRVVDLAGMLKLTISSVKAIKTSTGQDGATKVLFTGIDFALDVGMGVATGGASAAAKAGAKAAAKALAKKSTRAVTKKAVIAASKAALNKQARRAIAKKAGKKTTGRLAQGLLGDPAQQLENRARAAVGRPSAGAKALQTASNVLDATSSEAIFNKIYPSSPDDLEIKVNGSAIFPNGGRSKGRKISSQKTLNVGVELIFEAERGFDLQLIEYDYGSDDDSLGWFSWRMPEELNWIDNFVKNNGVIDLEGVLISRESEGSLYEINLKIEPMYPFFETRGQLGRKLKEDYLAREGCKPKTDENCQSYMNAMMSFKGWAKRKPLRNRVLREYSKYCENKNGTVSNQCPNIKGDPVRLACDAGHSASCAKLAKIRTELARLYKLKIQQINCEGQVSAQACIDWSATLIASQPIDKKWNSAAYNLGEFCKDSGSDACRMMRVLTETMCANNLGSGCGYRGEFARVGSFGPNEISGPSVHSWLEKGCDLNDGFTCMLQASFISADFDKHWQPGSHILETSIGVADKGCKLGSNESCTLSDKLKSKLTAEKEKPYYLCDNGIGGSQNSCRVAGAQNLEYAKLKDENVSFFYTSHRYYSYGCFQQNDGASCLAAGNLKLTSEEDVIPVLEGYTREKDALRFFENGCKLKDGESCAAAGKMYESASFSDTDLVRAEELYNLGCQPDPSAAVLENNTCDQAYRLKIISPGYLLLNACTEDQNPQSCLELANMGIKLYRSANANPEPMPNSGYKNRDSLALATSYYSIACDGNILEACKKGGQYWFSRAAKGLDIAGAEQFGHTISGDKSWFREAVRLYQKACESNDAESCLKGFNIVARPVFDLKDPTTARSLLTSACTLDRSMLRQGQCDQLGTTSGSSNNQTVTAQNIPDPLASTQNQTKKSTNGVQTVSLRDGLGCELRGQVKSGTADVAANVEFNNIGTEVLHVYWLDETGKETDYQRASNPLATVNPGDTAKFSSAIGYAYSVFTVDNGQFNCEGVVQVSSILAKVNMSKGGGNTVVQNGNQKAANQTQNKRSSNSQTQTTQDQVELYAGNGCEMRGSFVSNTSGENASVSFNNTGSNPVYVYWLDENGADTDYAKSGRPAASIEAGSSQTLNAKIGYGFSAFNYLNEQYTCVGVVELSALDTMVSINGDGSLQSNDVDQDQGQQNQSTQDNNQQNEVQDQVELYAGNGCEMRGSFVSNTSGENASVSFNNTGSNPVYVYWLDENGADTDYAKSGSPAASIEAGSSQTLNAKIGYGFSAFNYLNEQYTCVGVVELYALDTMVNINGDGSTQNNSSNQSNSAEQSQDQQSQQSELESEQDNSDSGWTTIQNGQGCELRGQVASYDSGEGATVSIYNGGQDRMHVYWLDEQGSENDYSGTGNPLFSLEPGQDESFDAAIGHAFSMFSDVDGNLSCVGVAEITQSQTNLEVSSN